MSQWDSIVESMPCAIIAINTVRNVVAFNTNALKQFHQTEQSFRGCSCINLLGGEICQQRCPLTTGKPFDEPARMAILLQMGSGGHNPVAAEVRSLPWYGAEHQWLGCIHLITPTRQCRSAQAETTVPDLSALGLLGSSSLMHEVAYLIRAVAPTPSTVLIQGETGTGKEIAAHIIYSLSGREKYPFVSLNCAALPENLIESELFGHEKGAFTGADKEHRGYFETAHRGTIFLDEIAETSLNFQAKLLRVLQSGEYQRLGSTQPRKTDARIIAATNKALVSLVQAKQFREDLYYRLNVFPIKMPPLRNRLGDLAVLVDYFIKDFAAVINKPITGINEVALTFLHQYDFPGNVRELKNILEYAFIKCSSSLIGPTDLPPAVIEHGAKRRPIPPGISEQNVLAVLNQCNCNKAKAARTLGISRKTLYHKLAKIKAVSKEL
jgi:transcriptional regulator with PAS, ATPase and Fis domain